MDTVHQTVLLHEATENLNLKEGGIFFDGTLGGGGHSLKVCSDFCRKVKIIATDRDEGAIRRVEEKLKDFDCDFNIVRSNYRKIDEVLLSLGIQKVDAILLDLGISSDQLETSGRGFSFQKDQPLLMTMSENGKVTAQMIVNDWSEETIADIIYAYSDETYARKIAKAIVEQRQLEEIKTTFDLVRIIESAVPPKYKNGKKIHAATKTFQALRIAANDEIGALKEGMQKGWDALNTNGRMAIISFHSIEDREVKNFFRDMAKNKGGVLVNKKVITASDAEIQANPRSRSAKLRIIEKIQ